MVHLCLFEEGVEVCGVPVRAHKARSGFRYGGQDVGLRMRRQNTIRVRISADGGEVQAHLVHVVQLTRNIAVRMVLAVRLCCWRVWFRGLFKLATTYFRGPSALCGVLVCQG